MTSLKKRCRTVNASAGELKAAYGRADGEGPDICGAWAGPGPQRADMNLLIGWMCFMPAIEDRSLVKELQARGYDLTTLKFSIRHKNAIDTTKPPQVAPGRR